MSGVLLNNGIFEAVGESCTIQLDPITQVTDFETFTDSISNQTATRTFNKEFRYKKGYNGTFTSFTALTNANLASIPTATSDVFYFEVKYTRQGTDTTGTLNWNCFELNSIKVDACIILKINKSSYDSAYGTSKYGEIIEKIAEFNRDMTERGLQIIFPVVDNTITEKTGRDMVIERKTCAKDMNVILRTLFGNYLTDDLFDIRIDTHDGIRS